jgi:DNA-binding MarR family transcriptional regulator
LTEAYLESPFSLTEARVIYELAHHDATTATDLCRKLGLDAGYLSRILRGLKKRGLIEAQPSGTDRRLILLKLTAQGQQSFAFLNFDPRRERCWIAERDGENVGSVFLVKKSRQVAKLRLLLVDPKARGMGIGTRLVEECLRFARQAGYRKITLWTNSILVASRKIYEKAGFELIESAPHHSFGHDLISETWERALL